MKLLKKVKKNIKLWIIKTAEKPAIEILENEFIECKTVLDVGSGLHSKLSKVKKHYYLEGIDILPKSRVSLIHDRYKRGNITFLDKYYKKKSFDGILCYDVIEHLTKKDALKLLKDMNQIAVKKIVIITPEGFHHQGEIDDNPYQKHLSGWKPEEFSRKGYKCHGLHGFKIFRGEEASIKYKPWYFWLFISHLSQYIAYFFPRIAFHILAIKSFKQR